MGRVRAPTESLAGSRRRLSLVFETLEGFREEFRANLVLGGLFVPTELPLELREEVDVELGLAFRGGARFSLRGEVVSVVPPELARAGGTPGVAVQLLHPPEELRRRFEPIVGAIAEPDRRRVPGDRRGEPRRPAQVLARLASSDGSVAGRTRDLSRSGVLVTLEGEPVPVGQRVRLALVHPTTGQALEVSGEVARHVASEGGAPALAVHFDPQEAARPEVVAFVESLQSAEHARRLAGISGALDEIGLASLLQSFAGCSPRGTLSVVCGAEEGRIVFEQGQLLEARLGSASGPKALARMLSWQQGRFEFHPRVDGAPRSEPPLPLQGALLEAVHQADEIARLGPLPVAPGQRLAVDVGKLLAHREELLPVEESVLELAGGGLDLRGILDVIPETDAVILAAARSLLEKGVLKRA